MSFRFRFVRASKKEIVAIAHGPKFCNGLSVLCKCPSQSSFPVKSLHCAWFERETAEEVVSAACTS